MCTYMELENNNQLVLVVHNFELKIKLSSSALSIFTHLGTYWDKLLKMSQFNQPIKIADTNRNRDLTHTSN